MVSVQSGSPFDEPVNILKSSNPVEVARKAGVTWETTGAGEGRLIVPVIHKDVMVEFPGVVVNAPEDLDTFTVKLLTLIHLSYTDGTAPSGLWTAYREFPGGRFYEPVVKRSVEDPLASEFGDDLDAFRKTAQSLKGKAQEYGNASYSFSLFPHVPILFIIWGSDDEFPARASVLFDSNCHHHLSTFDLRMGAQEISGRLIKKRG